MTEPVYRLREPAAPAVPLLVSIPHSGTDLPEGLRARFASPAVAALPDTDWHLDRLWDFVPRLGAKTILAPLSRYVVDLNRPRDGSALYPGRFETPVVPARTFADTPIYRDGAAPDPAEVAARLDACWQPYHDRIQAELAALRAAFGYALLFDAHSIASRVPRLFDGELPGLVLGDACGRSAAPALSRAVLDVHAQSGIPFRANHPFQGGYITRSYGRPEAGIHALQLEMSQRLYMDEGPPFRYRPDLADRLRPVLEATLQAFIAAGTKLPGSG